MNLKHGLLASLLVGSLAACGGDVPDVRPPAAQLGEAETNAAFSDLQGEVLSAVFSLNGDKSSLALRQLPKDAANFPLQAQDEAEQTLPRGRYSYDAEQNVWQRSADDDALILTWPYAESATRESVTLTLDWHAGADTVMVAGPADETLEAPTAFHITLVAADETLANVNVALSYYNSAACGTPQGIAEPMSLSVSGTGSLVDLADVGYSVSEVDASERVTSQGALTFKTENIVLGWNLSLDGEREREDCFTSDYRPKSGSVNVSLMSEAGSFAFVTDIDGLDVEEGGVTLSSGTVKIGGATAVSFEGTLDDQNENGIPGENVTLSFAGGKTVTLEQALQKSRMIGMLLQRM